MSLDFHAAALAAKALLKRWLPGPRWRCWPGVALLAGALLGCEQGPAAAPGCNDTNITDTLVRQVLPRMIAASGESGAIDSTLHFERAREVGYNRVRQARACATELTGVDVKLPYAFVIERVAEHPEGGFGLHSVNPDILQARFGKLDANGDFLYQAEPIGRANLSQAFLAGAAALADHPVNQQAEAMLRSAIGNTDNNGAAESKPDSDLEPAGACRPIKPDHIYACPLLVEWHNPLMAMLGNTDLEMVRGDFTFERNAAGAAQPWRVSAEFYTEIAQARLAAGKKKPPQAPSAPHAPAATATP